MHPVFYFIPVFGALIGWAASSLSLLLLIKPRRPISFGIIAIQGLIPKYAKQIAQQLAASLAADFSIESWLQERLESPDVQNDVKKLLNDRLDGLVNSLRHQIPMGEIFLTGSLADRLKKQATDELMKMLPEIPGALAAHLSLQEVSGSLLDKPVNPERQAELEAAVKGILKRDLMRLTWFGAFFGFLLGLIELALLVYR